MYVIDTNSHIVVSFYVLTALKVNFPLVQYNDRAETTHHPLNTKVKNTDSLCIPEVPYP